MKRKIAAFGMALMSGVSLAEPSSTVRWLMNEPATMFDIGMLRLRDATVRWQSELVARLDEIGGFETLVLKDSSAGSAVYNFDENRITVTAMFTGTPDEQTCEAILGEYRAVMWLGERLSRAASQPVAQSNLEFANNLFAGVFGHVNYEVAGAPAGWQDRIVETVLVTIGIEERPSPVTGQESDLALRRLRGEKTLFCTSPLTRQDVSFQKFNFEQ
jgi:hypothetical protein